MVYMSLARTKPFPFCGVFFLAARDFTHGRMPSCYGIIAGRICSGSGSFVFQQEWKTSNALLRRQN